MKALLEALARALVEQPGRVRVSQSEAGDELRLELQVAAADRGRVIGRQGRTADALRRVLEAAGRAQGRKVRLEVRA